MPDERFGRFDHRCKAGFITACYDTEITLTMNHDETARRAYWTEQMEQGYALVQKLIAFPCERCFRRE